VNGEQVFTGDVVEQTMPSDHQHVVARFHRASPDTVKTAITACADARDAWSNMPFVDRAAIFRKAADLIATKYRAKLLADVMLGTGKNVWQGEIDAAVETIDFFRHNCNFAEQIYESQPPLNSAGTWNRMEYRALEGFILAISPFNFCAIGANLAGAPLLMGNTVLQKPASTSVLGNYTVLQILEEAGLPAGVLNFLPAKGSTIGNTCVPHKDFAGLHFTGSTDTFNTLWRQIGDNLPRYRGYPRIVGETGGKNFHFVHKSANVQHVINNTIRGAFEYQGQKCSATSRMYVPDNLWPEIKAGLTDAVAAIKMGQPDEFDSFMTAVIDKTAFADITGYIEHAKAQSDCDIVAGGNYDDSKGYFVEPTIVVTTNPQTKTMVEEIFGPVLTIYVYPEAKYEETMALCDATSPFALTGALFATCRTAQNVGYNALRNAAGNFYLNDKSTGAVVGEQPFGGARASGTNDKAGSHLNLLRWISPRSVKETSLLCDSWRYPHMDQGE
jgi:1-pyrroline-5-carboxylate dehydrogenase